MQMYIAKYKNMYRKDIPNFRKVFISRREEKDGGGYKKSATLCLLKQKVSE